MTVKDCLLDERVIQDTRIVIFGNNFYHYLKIPEHISTREMKEKFIDNLSIDVLNKEVEYSKYEYVKISNEKYCGIVLK